MENNFLMSYYFIHHYLLSVHRLTCQLIYLHNSTSYYYYLFTHSLTHSHTFNYYELFRFFFPADLQVIESVKKVDDLYEKINRVQAVATDLPALILRYNSHSSVKTSFQE